MALHGKMILNGADYATFNIYGVGVFMAHSGDRIYRNNGACRAITNDGPLPRCKYWIVERGSCGLASKARAKALDLFNRFDYGTEFGRDEWFALYKDDWGINDGTWVDGVHRVLFRLHPDKVSKGCITIDHNSDYALIRNALLKTTSVQVPCIRSLIARGWVAVINGYKDSCP